MAAIDKIYGTQEQWQSLHDFLLKHKRSALIYLYPKEGYDIKNRPISNFPSKIDKWLWKHCDMYWVQQKLSLQYDWELNNFELKGNNHETT